MSVIDGINFPEDIKQLNIKDLESLAGDLREKILTTVMKNGGHLASNFGVVETTIALHRTFDFKKDRLIFDVGHQCYAHKILSDRKDKFDTIRCDDGISGFPDSSESKYDAFTAGHAGTSISAGLGYCAARDKVGDDYYVVIVVGDASLANGLNLEAISAKNYKPKRYIVILNDNGMSISKNDNGFYRFISKHTANKSYLKSKRRIKKIFGDSFITKGLVKIKDALKRIIGRNNFFENYGFKYVGVVDGNNVKKLTKILENVKQASEEKAIFLHLTTTKGKGHEQAEEHADVFHGVGAKLSHNEGAFSLALGEKLNSIIEQDKNVVAITAGMKDGTGLSVVEEKNPENFYDVGIAEEFAVTFAAGMAAGGLKPFVCVYSTFLQRSYDQIMHDVCLQNLPVVFCLDRAGLVGSDGKTHQGVFDLSYLSHIPNLTLLAPSCPSELKDMIDYALTLNSPVAIRYPKDAKTDRASLPIKDGLWERLKNGDKTTILAVGPRMLDLALKLAKDKPSVGVINARTIKPLCEKTLTGIENTTVIVLEENSQTGGLGSLVTNHYAKKGVCVKTICFGVKDKFIEHGSVSKQLEQNGLTFENIEKFLGK